MSHLTRNQIFKTLAGIVAASFIAGSVSIADKMDKDTHTLLIDKLERVLSLMESGSDKRLDIVLRLADLHAERARLEDMDQGEKDADKTSNDAKTDRTRSLELYKEALNNISGELRGKVTFQMAQIDDLQGERGLYQISFGLV
jgi:hypothetical protein